MALYPYRCSVCGALTERHAPMTTGSTAPACQDCGVTMTRVYTVPMVIRDMHEHFNSSLGIPVGSRRDWQEGLKRKSEEASKRTGLEHRFVEVDPTDTKALGVTEEGLDSQARARFRKEDQKRKIVT